MPMPFGPCYRDKINEGDAQGGRWKMRMSERMFVELHEVYTP